MFRITEDPSSVSLVQCWAKNYKNGSIVSVDMDKVGVMAAYATITTNVQRILHQGALYSAWLKITRMVLSCPLTWRRSVLWQHMLP
jgi:hypothetical protein